MREHAGAETFCAISDKVVERAGDNRNGPIRHCVRETKSQGDDGKGEPGKGAEGQCFEFFRNHNAEEESAPKDFLDQRHDDDESEETQPERRPVLRRHGCEGDGIKTKEACWKTKKLLR